MGNKIITVHSNDFKDKNKFTEWLFELGLTREEDNRNIIFVDLEIMSARLHYNVDGDIYNENT